MTAKNLSRRDAIKLLGAALGATALANLPSKWNKPELASGVLPAHAQTSVVVSCVGYAPGSQTFSSPGILDFVVPACVTSLTVDAYGAQGGFSFNNSSGGQGGRTTFVIAVTPGESLTISVGGIGGDGSAGGSGGAGGTNGGGDGGGQSNHGGGGGGGWSGVSRSGTILVAAGGGAGASFPAGGVGGDVIGGNGSGAQAGTGGTQVAGGTGANIGSSGQGGDGIPGGVGGGGGGGGYFGGGGGGDGSSGGGGSSFPPAATHQQGVRSGDGQVILTW